MIGENCPLINYIKNTVELDASSVAMISERVKEVTFLKGHFILPPGSKTKYAYFLVDGYARSYFTDKHGNTVTWFFHFNGADSTSRNVFISDHSSYLDEIPGYLAIEALTDVRVVQWSHAGFQEILDRVPAIALWMRKLNENFFIDIYKRIFSMLALSAPERYKAVLEEEPHIPKMFSNHYLASYLGIADQSLCRIKGDPSLRGLGKST